jgi:hypothetical protein
MRLRKIKSTGEIRKRAVEKLKSNTRLRKIEPGTFHKLKP